MVVLIQTLPKSHAESYPGTTSSSGSPAVVIKRSANHGFKSNGPFGTVEHSRSFARLLIRLYLTSTVSLL
jgi:hypothetical protein